MESYIQKLGMGIIGVVIIAALVGMFPWFEERIIDSPWLVVILISSGVAIIGYFVASSLIDDTKDKLRKEFNLLKAQMGEEGNKRIEAEKKMKDAEDTTALWKKTLTERAAGFPTLFTSIAAYEQVKDEYLSNYLRTKPHPALTSADLVRAEAKRRREAEFANRTTQSIIEYYENIAPFLLEYKNELIDENDEGLREYTQEELEDPTTNFLTKEEYYKLSTEERNQMALDRFWRRPHKSKWLIGRLYERYVGYLYEMQGYDVEYVGVFQGKGDLGRDLVCTKGKEVIVIQCKNWSQFKTVFENNIFQFFGTVFQYRDSNPDKKVKAIFYTTTEVSDLARRFAGELGIELKEKFKLPNDYPCIKCNISREGTKIYHLPFDQQYDNTMIEIDKGEFYCAKVLEAEKKGFRRAFRWHSTNK